MSSLGTDPFGRKAGDLPLHDVQTAQHTAFGHDVRPGSVPPELSNRGPGILTLLAVGLSATAIGSVMADRSRGVDSNCTDPYNTPALKQPGTTPPQSAEANTGQHGISHVSNGPIRRVHLRPKTDPNTSPAGVPGEPHDVPTATSHHFAPKVDPNTTPAGVSQEPLPGSGSGGLEPNRPEAGPTPNC